MQNLSDFDQRIAVVACSTHKNLDHGNFNIYHIRYSSENLIAKLFISMYAFIIGLYALIKEKPDIIYKRQSSIGEDILIAKLAGCPVVTEINGSISEEQGSRKTIIHKIINNILIYISKQSILHSDHLVTVTPNLKEVIQNELHISSKKITVIPNGANVRLFHPAEKEVSCRLLNLSCNLTYICFIGNLASYQGIEYLIQASPLILTACPDVHFLIVGDGPMRNEWMQIAQKNCVYDKFIFTGSVPIEKVPLYINASDACVAPFKIARNAKIGLSPLKIYEYMACGKPVVSSRIPNLEFIEEQNTGLLVEPENPKELAKAIIKLIKDKSLREKMGKNGRELAVKNYSWKANARKVAELCDNLIKDYNRVSFRT